MKNRNVLFSVAISLFCGIQSSQASTMPSGLTIEYIRDTNNVEIADPRPEFSWHVPQQAVNQSAYQLLVASSKQNIEENIGDIWDSHKVNSSSSINIEHDGVALSKNSRYFWKVRIWDKLNQPSNYSQIQSFKTGSFDGYLSTANSIETEQIRPQHFTQLSSGHYLIDFGKDAFGTLELTYHATSKETLIIHVGEKLKQGRVDTNPGGTIRYQKVKLRVTPKQTHYILQLPADERNTNEHGVPVPNSAGVIIPFRYAEIENAKQNITAKNVTQRAIFHYFEDDQSLFSSSDAVLNAVWDISKYSMKATSTFGVYVDGDRERIPYEADAYINQLSHYNVDAEYAMGKQTIEYFMQNPTWPTEWLLHTALIIYQDYYHSGDTELIAAYYDKLKHKTLIELSRADGLITSESPLVTDQFMQKLGFKDPTRRLKDIVDWPPGQKDTKWQLATEAGERDGYDLVPVNTVVNSFFYQNMLIMAELATVLGKNDDAKQFSQLANQVKQSVNEKLFDKTRGVYLDGEGSTHASLHANMMPLAFGMVPEEYIPSVVAFIKSRGMACSVYGAQYLLEGLYKAGEGQYGLDLMRATHDRSWYNMIKVGSTITMEAWDMKYKPNSDWNHAWGAAPANIVGRYLWGIQPKTPGFTNIIIRPQMADLKHSEIVVPTLSGKISGSYQLQASGSQKFSFIIPANTTAEFIFNELSKRSITLNDEKVKGKNAIILLPGANEIFID
ncbi:family 78 glycoside hydrolase catalytic domain [uncultured Paraglaciecola sp.]|uniref:family 78 glycoside hydrolase catalytic domain n=1 Tax=uncultured Paraglaciecola sp. TaxID=1765024 RepID=UPI0030D9AA05|tara:strand:+ start:369562 stop:371745 length:2184 start_codon:yes stop_codon:yes gene_type:complete